jgi:hypothetical protein
MGDVGESIVRRSSNLCSLALSVLSLEESKDDLLLARVDDKNMFTELVRLGSECMLPMNRCALRRPMK